ncbi:MAG: choice-of-anchor tandem repeat GloVer-containing protein [Bryobacteraceae bacterium]|jgi:uncharacterized repeat protein (TIGR03803 family)
MSGRQTKLHPILLAALAIMARPIPAAAQSPAYEVVYSFHGSPDGVEPYAALTIGPDGALYGTTSGGGTSQYGTVFKLTHSTGEPWRETVLHSFIGTDGKNPASTPVFGESGALYGTTYWAIAANGNDIPGTVFELAPPAAAGGPWTETVLDFLGSGQPEFQSYFPNGTIAAGPDGTLYVTTQGEVSPRGSTGMVLALVPPAPPGASWTQHELYTFPGDAARPLTGIISQDGSLIGTTFYGGSVAAPCTGSCGAVYQLSPPQTPGAAWTETTLWNFDGADGNTPMAPVTAGPDGVLYGTTHQGGDGPCVDGCGVVYQLTPPAVSGGPWTESVLYSFQGYSSGDGSTPLASVVVGRHGILYGTTASGGTGTAACPQGKYGLAGCGTVFELVPPADPSGSWTETVLHSFSGEGGDGLLPPAGLALSSTGVLYGVTRHGGKYGLGAIFAIAP